MCIQAPLHVTNMQSCFSVQVRSPCSAKCAQYLHVPNWHVCIILRFISGLEIHGEIKKGSQCFDKHSWTLDKTTFNSFEFRHWLINWHKNYVLKWKFNHFSVNCSLFAKVGNNWVWRSSEVLLLPLELRSQFRKCRDCVRKWLQIIFKEWKKKSGYKRGTKSSGETGARFEKMLSLHAKVALARNQITAAHCGSPRGSNPCVMSPPAPIGSLKLLLPGSVESKTSEWSASNSWDERFAQSPSKFLSIEPFFFLLLRPPWWTRDVSRVASGILFWLLI